MLERLMILCVNLLCPPIAVLMVAGPGTDTIINTILFVAGVIPGHIHGFYITCTYFHRKNKVKKGRYPGGKKRMIYSRRVLNGDATSALVMELEERENRGKEEREMRRSTRSWGLSSRSAQSEGGDGV